MTQEFQNRSQTVPSSPKSTISKWTQTCLLQLLIKCITNLILLSIFPTGLNNDTCDINHRMSCDRTTITFHIFKCVKFIKQCKSSIVAFFSKKSTKASRIQSSWSPVWTVVARVCLSLRFMLMKLYSVAITHARQICPLRTLSNHHPAEGPSHTCDLPRLDSPTWGVRKRVFPRSFWLFMWRVAPFCTSERSWNLQRLLSVSFPLGRGVCVCGKAGAKSVEKKNERDVQTANKFTCLGKTGCHVVSGCQDVTMWFLIGPSEKCPTPFFSEHLWDLMWRFISGADETRDTRCQCWVWLLPHYLYTLFCLTNSNWLLMKPSESTVMIFSGGWWVKHT